MARGPNCIPSVVLNTGARQPLVGLGTWQALNDDELKMALRVALDEGYRLIDTADTYQNEHIIGEVLEEYFSSGKLQREELFVTTKLPFNAMHPEDAEASIKKQLAALRFSYVDLYLIHCPCAMKFACGERNASLKATTMEHQDVPHIDTWRVLEKYYKSGQLKAIGVSNFNASQLQNLYDKAEIKPANLQVEVHLYWPQHELLEVCKKLNMTMTAYAPIGSPGRQKYRPDVDWPLGSPMNDPLVIELSEKYGKTPAQILLRHHVQRGIAVVPKSTNPERIRQNIDIFDFELDDDDHQRLLDVQTGVRLFELRFCAGSKEFPFDDVDFTKKGDQNESV